MQPNVLLIVLDTARADAFEPYGAVPGSSPVVADLARRGSAFPMMVSTSCWTIPAHASLFTGLLPRAVGFAPALWTVPDLRTVVPAVMARHADRTLAEVLRRAGYGTRALSTNPMVRGPHGFGTGFERFSEARNVRALTLEVLREKFDRLKASRGVNLRRRVQRWKELVRWWRATEDNGAARAANTVREWIAQRDANTPFFWFVNLIETHNPYFPPKPYNGFSGAERWRAMEDVFRYESYLEVILTCKGDLDIPEDALLRMRHLYARSVQYLDGWIRGVFEELDGHGLLDDTLVMITSDHGESFYENHLVNHGWSMDQRQLHVPFVAAGPGAPPARPLASLAEVPRMIAEAAGIEDHPFIEDPLPGGVAVAQKDVTFQGRDEILERARLKGVPEGDLLRFMARTMACATDGSFKLSRIGEREALYDLARDPLEATDVSTEHPDRVRSLRAALDATGEAPQPVTVPAGDGGEIAAEEEAEIEAQLEGLGYI